MSVEDWASEQAGRFVPNLVGQFGFKSGIVHAFSALLSDEAWDFLPRWNDEEGESITRAQAIRLVQAAVDAVTEGDTE